MARYGAAIVKESRRLTEMIGQVLAYGGMQSRAQTAARAGRYRSRHREAVAQCRWMAEEQGVAIETHVDRGLPLVEATPRRSRAPCRISSPTPSATARPASGSASARRRDGDSVVITVEDRGPGIAARDLPHLFEPFYRGRGADRVRGSGLGLTIVKQIARAHGGSVAVERRRERGAAFTLRCPRRCRAVGDRAACLSCSGASCWSKTRRA